MWVFEYRTFCFKCIYYRDLPDHFMLRFFFTWLYLGNSTALICVGFLFIIITVIFIIIITVTIAVVYQFPSFYLFFLIFCGWGFCLHVWTYVHHALTWGGQKTASDPLALELHTDGCELQMAGNRICMPRKRSKCS